MLVLGSESPLLWWYGFPVAFALTWLIELPVYLAAFAALGWCGPTGPTLTTVGPRSALALAVNLVTHPALWAVSPASAEAAPADRPSSP